MKAVHIETMIKSNKRLQKATNGCYSTYDKCRATRPFILTILRNYDDLEGDIEWSVFLRVAYTKATSDFLPVLDVRISELDGLGSSQREGNYLKKFRKNLLKLKKKCEDSSIDYYNYLPGNKLPLDVRTHIIGFISMAN
jgi:hypothetical protein